MIDGNSGMRGVECRPCDNRDNFVALVGHCWSVIDKCSKIGHHWSIILSSTDHIWGEIH